MKKIVKNFKKFLADRKIKLSKVSSKKIVVAAGLMTLLLVLYLGRSLFVAAVVNNTIITRFSLDRELEKQGGKQLLENKINQALVTQEGAKQKIKITPEDISLRVKEIETQIPQGQKLDDLLSAYGLSRSEFEKQLSYEIMVTKLLEKNLKISDEEIKSYFEANKSSYPKGATLESVKDEIEGTLKQNGLSEKYQTLLTDLKQKAKIFYFLSL